MVISNRRALLVALEALELALRDVKPGYTREEVIYGNWDMEARAAERYAEIVEAMERIRSMLEE